MQQKVYQTHSEYRWVQVETPWFRRGQSWTTDISLQLSDSGDVVSIRVTRVWKLMVDIVNNICV